MKRRTKSKEVLAILKKRPKISLGHAYRILREGLTGKGPGPTKRPLHGDVASVMRRYQARAISPEEAAEILQVSRSTFYRRLREMPDIKRAHKDDAQGA